MKKASLVIKEIQEGSYNDILKVVYIDENRIEKQPQRYVEAIEKFISLYGDQEIEIYSTPGRSEVSGNHTDHQNGEVLAAAINLDIIAVVSKNDVVKVLSDDYDLKPISLDDLSKNENEVGTSEGLMRGVLARFKELGYDIGGFNGYMTSDVLQGSGLSSSAAFEVMIGTILSGLYNEMKVDPVVIGQVGQYSENVYFGKPCGLMDQSACSVGSLIHIDFKDNSKPVVEKVDVEFSSFKHSLCIVDVHASHADLTDDYAAVPYEMKKVAQFFGKEVLREVDEKDFYNQLVEVRKEVGDRAILRAIHLFNENKRVEKAVSSLKNNDFDTFRQVIKNSGDSSYKYLQNVYSNKYPDNQAVSLALALSEGILENHGVCRVHGGGFAGTIQAFVEDEYVDHYKEEKYAQNQRECWYEIYEYMKLLISNNGKSKELGEDYIINVPKAEAAAYLEWILWRAFLAIDHIVNKPYDARGFNVDQDYLPIGTAPGGKPDMIFEFDDYVIVVEVTLSTNSRQEAMEGEPVRRHVADLVQKYKKPVYGLFVANKIDSNTAETFRMGVWYTTQDERLELHIVPLTLTQFSEYFKFIFTENFAEPQKIVDLMCNCENYRKICEGPEWKKCINEVVQIMTKG